MLLKWQFKRHDTSQAAPILCRSRPSAELEIEQVDDGKCLRFYIATEEDFQRFKQCMVNEPAQAEFISANDLEDTPQQD
jgi:uncharacterized membrane protein